MNRTSTWNIEKSKLSNYRKEGWTEDYFLATPNKDYGILVYNIEEWRMLAYAGLIGIYSNQENPKLELNSDKSWIWFDNDKTFNFLEKSNCIACRKPAYNPNSSKGDFPFLLINLRDRKFGFIEFDGTSIYYGLEETIQGEIKIIEVHSKDLENLKSEKRTNEIVDISTIQWFNLSDFDKALEIYLEEEIIKSGNPKELKQISEVIKSVLKKITDDTDVIWAGYDNPIELRTEIENDLKELENGNLNKLETFKTHFLPTATFQEISLSNGWGDEFINLAETYDKLYNKITAKKSQHTTRNIANGEDSSDLSIFARIKRIFGG